MTIEEAKEIFLNRGFVNGLFDGDKWRQSIVVISKWLEQEPCEDCISRQAVLKLQYRIDDSATLSTRDVVNVEDIEDLLSVTPKPKTEKEIVRSYLEKLNEHIINFHWGDTNGDFMTGVNAVYNLIDNVLSLLSEETTEESLPPVTPKLQMVQNPCVECGCNYCTNDDCENRYIVDIVKSEE